MEQTQFKALVIRERTGGFEINVETRRIADLPQGEVLIKISYAALNYKDALSSIGNRGVTKTYPHTPGIDGSGVVVKSSDPGFSEGDEVLVTSYDLGMNTDGAFAEYIRVPAKWVVSLPKGIDLREAMILGTAGYTAALALHKMEMSGQRPDMGEVVVTGATGGVGSMAICILHKAGYRVVASSGKTEEYDWLQKLGAKRCINRSEVSDTSGRPLLTSQWAGAIDTIGGNTLATLLKTCRKNGNVASCGLVASPELQTTVFPFILNGINLLGVDSAETDRPLRLEIWQKLSAGWKPDLLDDMVTEVGLEQIPRYMEDMLYGEGRGRVVARIAGKD